MIDDNRRMTPRQKAAAVARIGRSAAARRRRLDKAAAALHEHGWLVCLPDGTLWRKPGDAR